MDPRLLPLNTSSEENRSVLVTKKDAATNLGLSVSFESFVRIPSRLSILISD